MIFPMPLNGKIFETTLTNSSNEEYTYVHVASNGLQQEMVVQEDSADKNYIFFLLR